MPGSIGRFRQIGGSGQLQLCARKYAKRKNPNQMME